MQTSQKSQRRVRLQPFLLFLQIPKNIAMTKTVTPNSKASLSLYSLISSMERLRPVALFLPVCVFFFSVVFLLVVVLFAVPLFVRLFAVLCFRLPLCDFFVAAILTLTFSYILAKKIISDSEHSHDHTINRKSDIFFITYHTHHQTD